MRRLLAWLAAATVVLSLLPAVALAKGGRGERTAAQHALEKVKDLKKGIGVRTGRELTPALADLAARRGTLDSTDRKQAATFLARPTDSTDSDYYGNTFIGSVQTYCPASSIYCFHWVSNPASDDAPDLTDSGGVGGVPDYIESMAAVFDEVHGCENGAAVGACAQGGSTGIGWQEPVPDGATGGGSNKFDVYIKDLFVQGFYGYAAPECPNPLTTNSCPAYMVMDKDYDRFATATETGLDAMKVTAAHEYNHVLQFGYDVIEDTWMFESTATWAEEKAYPSINDYLQYLPDWVNNYDQPLTEPSTASNLKIYGSAVWNHWLDHGYSGDDVIQSAWAQSPNLPMGYTDSLAPDAYKKSIVDRGGTGFSEEFENFSAAVAEWRVSGSSFPDLYPDVPRAATLTANGSGVQRTLDHTTFQFLNVAPPGTAQSYTLSATVDSGVKSAIALVGRTGGSTTSGTVTTQITRLPSGGSGTVTLPNVNTYGRITAVLINADYAQSGYNNGTGDWQWTHDNVHFSSVKVSSIPTVTTSAATSVSMTGATLNGTVNPNTQATTYWFEYGTTTSYGTETTHTSAGSGSTAIAKAEPITGLTRGTTYHYRIVAQNGSGTAFGSDQMFTTLDPPIVTTGAANPINATSATLNGTVDPRGRSTTYKFEYGTTASYGSQVTGGPTTTSGGVSLAVSGLTQGTTYHFRLVATNADGTTNGSDQTFTTKDPPIVTTDPASSISGTGATLNGTVDTRGQATTYQFQYGTTASYGSWSTGGPTAGGSVSDAITGLAPGTIYHFRIVATNVDGTTNGSDQTFTTPGPPIVSTTAVSGVDLTGATLNGTVNPTGLSTQWWFQYGTDTSYGTETAHASAGSGSSASAQSAAITGLTRGTTYHYRIVASNTGGTVFGNDATLTTSAAPVSDGGSSTPAPSDSANTPPPAKALGLTLSVVTPTLRSLRARGLRLRASCREICNVTVKLVISARDAKRLRLKVTVASVKGRGGATLKLRLPRKASRVFARLKSIKAKLVVAAVAPDARKASLSKPLALRR